MEYALEMKHINKSFPGLKALDDVTLQVRPNEIHGLVGENGAGKSTLMKILAGIYNRDSGTVILEGTDITEQFNSRNIVHMGISFIHQERYVVGHLTVAEMLFLGDEKTYSPVHILDKRKMEKEAEQMLRETVGLEISARKSMAELSVSQRQLVQICRALKSNPKVIVFDEPTAVLAKKEVEILFSIIRELKKRASVIYISHYFGEVLELCDMVTVLRNGKKIETLPTVGVTIDQLVQKMIGREMGNQYPPKDRKPGELLLKVQGLSYDNYFEDLNFELYKGEILGITGLMGSGHDMVAQAIYNFSEKHSKGSVTFKNKKISHLNPGSAVKEQMGYVPDDRRGLGAIQDMPIGENITLASMGQVSKCGFISSKKEKAKVTEFIDKLRIKASSAGALASTLSGGNQQKVVMARWLCAGTQLYLLNQPTSGVDMGARAEIYKTINNLAHEGAAVIIISQDIGEICGMCDKVIPMFRGKMAAQLTYFEINQDIINVAIMGGRREDG